MTRKYRTYIRANRKGGKPFLLLLTPDEHEYLERRSLDRGGNMALYLRGKVFIRGWRRELDELRTEKGPLAKPPKVS